ncbi:MAG: helix-turn-helix transcriptional regulator [Bacteroidales bacterium]|nr:helix-turn-helix transcriptional regulator [Bacteroidales bacterium]
MTKDFIQDPIFPECPIRNVLSRLGSKWALAVLYSLSQSAAPLRFRDIASEMPDCSQKVLTSTLRGLEADGLVSRKVYPEVPPRVEYALTDRGQSFMPVMQQLMEWAYDNLHAIISNRERYMAQDDGKQ